MSRTRDAFLDWLVLVHGFALEVPFRGLSGKRRWRWDACKDQVAVEYHGQGAHTSYVAGTWRDQEKVTEGQLCGFVVLQCNAMTVREGTCHHWVERALEGRTCGQEA
jgi:hypothetical protein